MSERVTLSTSRHPLANMLIAAVIVVALACLVIPAIVAARTSSRQMECANNIRQIAMALVNYSSVHKQFPTGTLHNDQLTPESRLSWDTEIWNYLEGGTHVVLDRQKAWNDPVNLQMRFKVREYDDRGNEFFNVVDFGSPSLFRCPDLEPAIKFGNLIQTAYVGPSGVGQESLVSTDTRPDDGIWGYHRSTALDQICDGLANTLLLLETSVENGPWTAGGPPTVREIEKTNQPAFGIGRQFGGLHMGITNVAFADGSAKALNDDIDMAVLVELVGVCDSQK